MVGSKEETYQRGHIAVLNEVTELNPVDERSDGVKGEAQEQRERGFLCWTVAATEGLQEDDGAE